LSQFDDEQLTSLAGKLQLQQAFADDAVNAESVCTSIQADPAITTKLIMISNSALYGGKASIESLQQAVVRLGLETTRKQVMTYAVKKLFQEKTPDMQAHMRRCGSIASISPVCAV